ncbi:TetR family transcriptional regulator [Cohnella xylanilytica]|uniref:acyl-CoA-like ligand-binding transcription factor n=1 Tax=Cohnella xylanilytica TaxID=557555 RepID=UPI001AFE29EE|nr:TetR family transcriptional regulator [Cohnella xylanilytica]GIO13770.1 TetR family transcriptional regulator [Cohnella xylanilytica]
MTATDSPKTGLREKKKAKTRAVIQANAMRLFREQGYQATTIEQIADASEVSPSTMFRYFPTKEALVIEDEFDPMLIELYSRQPPGMSPIQAFLQTVREGSARIPPEARRAVRERMELIYSVPELRAANMSQMSETLNLIAGLIAERTGKDRGDLSVLALAGAIIGAVFGAHAYCASHPEEDYIDAIQDALEQMDRTMTSG